MLTMKSNDSVLHLLLKLAGFPLTKLLPASILPPHSTYPFYPMIQKAPIIGDGCVLGWCLPSKWEEFLASFHASSFTTTCWSLIAVTLWLHDPCWTPLIVEHKGRTWMLEMQRYGFSTWLPFCLHSLSEKRNIMGFITLLHSRCKSDWLACVCT